MILLLLAQVDPSAVANGLSKDPLAWGLALALVAIVFLYKQNADLRAEQLSQMRADAKEQREILQQVVPLAEKMIEVTERLTDRLDRDGGS